MLVGIDATCWSNQRGYGRYARGLLSALLAESTSHDFLLFVDSQTAQEWPLPEGTQVVTVATSEAPTAAATASGRRSLRDLWAMSGAVARVRMDAFFFPSLYTFFPIRNRAKVLLGVHDVIPEDYPTLVFPDRRQRLLWQAKSWLARRQADFIVTVSDYARDGIVRRFGWDRARVWVVGEAPDLVFKPVYDEAALASALAKHGLEPTTRFVVCLGGLNPHKNLDVLFRSLAELRSHQEFSDLHLVLIGPAETDVFTPGAEFARQAVSGLGLNGAVRFTGYIPDVEAACLLTAAQLLAMPSLEEGFGLGAVEAAACGTPVVATKNSPLPQLLAGAGRFVDPLQSDEVTVALADLLSDNGLRGEMGRVALQRARELTWSRAAEQFQSLLTVIEAGG